MSQSELRLPAASTLVLVAPERLAEEIGRQMAVVSPAARAHQLAVDGTQLPVCRAFARDLTQSTLVVNGRRLGADVEQAAAALGALADGDRALTHRLSALMSQEVGHALMLAIAQSQALHWGGLPVLALSLGTASASGHRFAAHACGVDGRLWVELVWAGELTQLTVRCGRRPRTQPVGRALRLAARLSVGPGGQEVRCEEVGLRA